MPHLRYFRWWMIIHYPSQFGILYHTLDILRAALLYAYLNYEAGAALTLSLQLLPQSLILKLVLCNTHDLLHI
jgi:hypothetical protein